MDDDKIIVSPETMRRFIARWLMEFGMEADFKTAKNLAWYYNDPEYAGIFVDGTEEVQKEIEQQRYGFIVVEYIEPSRYRLTQEALDF